MSSEYKFYFVVLEVRLMFQYFMPQEEQLRW